MKPRDEGGVVDARLNVFGKILLALTGPRGIFIRPAPFRYTKSQVCRFEYLPSRSSYSGDMLICFDLAI